MSDNSRRPILYRGEQYSSPILKGGKRTLPEPKISYEEARDLLIKDIQSTSNELRNVPAQMRMPNEAIVCLRMQPEFSAKSYYPSSLFSAFDDIDGMQEIGSRLWRPKQENKGDENIESKPGKLLFVRTTEEALVTLQKKLNSAEDLLSKSFMKDVRKLSGIDLLRNEEQVLGFHKEWQAGRIEAVLHPFALDSEQVFFHFVQLLQKNGIDPNSLKYKQYDGGVTFVSIDGDRKLLDILQGYNPLRMVHPLSIRDLPSLIRGTVSLGIPKAPIFSSRPSTILGVLDGGIEPTSDHLKNYVEAIDAVPDEALAAGIEHGTQVSSAALFGPLNHYNNNETLPEPKVFVRNFRVLSSKNIRDRELYETIDAIEGLVPKNPDIKVYNLSIGPRGPILDDVISRFTFALDLLSAQHNILFCTAVGNDGLQTGYDRIQSPSDMVNGLAIGAYTIIGNDKVRAPYSCIGPGREGNKLKPDLLGFGGCDRNPIQLLSTTAGHKSYTSGTSFASPIVASVAARLIDKSNSAIDSTVARALLVHSTAEKTEKKHCFEMGHGTLPDNINDIAVCPQMSYTLIYQGEIDPGKYGEYQIPWPKDLTQGTVNFRWTLAVLTGVDPQSPDDYTSSTIEIAFYPNSKIYGFTKAGQSPKYLNVELKADEVAQLEMDGWKRSAYPKTASKSSGFQTEHDLRADLKWDSVDTRAISKRASGINYPVFHLHAINRAGARTMSNKVKFALVLTVDAPKAKMDIYSKVRNEYSALVPIKIDLQVDVTASAKV
ncbi:S8 family peptidase [Chitinophaga sp.]|uniref:S8 family peptidase n=1 Tax=Chitinophaga sp. TaxID=1869181 RepID=UPI0031D750A2